MHNKHMGVTPKKESAREDCGQEAKRLFKEVKRLLYEMVMESVDKAHRKLELFKSGSEDLKNFIVEEISQEYEYGRILEKLEDLVKEEEERTIREKGLNEMTESLWMKFKERKKMEKIESRLKMRCYNCGNIRLDIV